MIVRDGFLARYSALRLSSKNGLSSYARVHGTDWRTGTLKSFGRQTASLRPDQDTVARCVVMEARFLSIDR